MSADALWHPAAAVSPKHRRPSLPPKTKQGRAMQSVDISVDQSDLVDTLSSMRVWLDHRKATARGFRSARDAAGTVVLSAEFDDEKDAAAFRKRFASA